MKIKNAEWTKRIIATALSLIMVIGLLPFSAFAADSDANIESSLGDFFNTSQKGDAPEQFNTAGDPYGEIGAFNLSPQNELLKIFTGGDRSTGSTTNDAYITEGFQLYSTPVNDYSDAGTVIRHTDNPVEAYDYIQAVAFDPDGIGRDTHVAYVGYNADKNTIRMGVYDAVNGRSAENTRWVADASWIGMQDGVLIMQFNAYNFMSITAGDYDGDGKETVVVFGSGNGNEAILTEFYYSSSKNYIYKQDSGNGLLHEHYIDTEWTGNEITCNKLGADLATGDFDGDGIDDLAVVSYPGIERIYEYEDYLEHIAPQLYVALGKGEGKHIVSQTSHNITVYDGGSDGVFELGSKDGTYYVGFPASPSIAAGNMDGDSADEIVIGGYNFEIKGDVVINSLFGLSGETDGVKLYSYNVTDSGIDRFSSVTTTVNTWTESMLDTFNDYLKGDYFLELAASAWANDLDVGFYFPQVGMDFVRTNGAGAPEDLFVNGSFLKYSAQKNDWPSQYQHSYFESAVKGIQNWSAQIGFITNTSVGVFNDNSLGREQIAYTVYIKDGASDNLIGTTDNADDYSVFAGISGGRYYSDTGYAYGEVREYASSGLTWGYPANGYQEFHNEQFDHGDGKNLLFVAVDVDNDGVLAKYADKDYAYSDPTIITVLQASPYYDAFGYLDKCETSYTFETSFIVGQTTSNSSSFSIGVSVEAETPVVKSSISTGYTGSWDESFTSQFETTYSTTFTATKDNVVVMQRTPVILYKYLLQKPDGTWSDAADEDGNYIIISVPAEPVYALVTVEEYNAFVNSEYYQSSISEHRLSPINMDELLGNAGDPTDYFTQWPEDATNLSASTYQATTSPGSITSAYSTSSSETLEQSTTQGFYFESSVSAGFSAFGSGVFAGIEFSTEGSTTQGSFTTTVDSTTVSGTVGNLGESGLPAASLANYVFDWQFGSWKMNLGSNANIYAYGYRVMNAKSVGQITDLKVTDGTGDTEEAVLTWSAVEDATGYVVYTYKDGEYTKIADIHENTYIYEIPADSRQYEYSFSVTYVKNGIESIYSNPVTYYRKSYGLSAYELALQNGFEGTVEEWLESLVGKDGEDGVGVANFTYNNAGELLAHLTDGTIINLGVLNGEDGENGLTPYIDENGNWWIGETDTGVKATGEDGADGIDGITPQLRINTETNEWEVSLDNGATWSSTGVKATGEKGEKGDKGDTGNGIASIEKTKTEGNVDTYTITYTDGTTTTFTVTNGKDGIDGINGTDGEDGHSPVITIQNGFWYIDGANTDIRAEGLKGDAGNGISAIEKTGTNGLVDTYTITFTDGSTTTFTVTNGKDGIDGIDGTDGEDGRTPVITIQDGYWYVDGVNTNIAAVGVKGEDGKDGKDGITPKLRINEETKMWEVSYDNGATWESLGISAVGSDGTHGSDGQDGVTPLLRINDQNIWEVSYNNGNTWVSLGVSAVGSAGADGTDGSDGRDGIDGKDGADGKDGQDGVNGKDGITPQLRINAETNEWEVSYDNGNTWISLGAKATGEKGEKGDPGAAGKDGEDGHSTISIVMSGASLALVIIMFCIFMADRKKRSVISAGK